MPRQESDREDILREATALKQRAELRIAGCDEPIVIGFRASGAASIFFGADPVYQFNAAGELRRAYVAGLLYKAERGQLVALRRERSEAAVALVRSELAADELSAFLMTAEKHLALVRTAFAAGTYTLLGQVPENIDLPRMIRDWLANLPEPIRIASIPNVR